MQYIKFIMYLRDNWILFAKISASIALGALVVFCLFFLLTNIWKDITLK